MTHKTKQVTLRNGIQIRCDDWSFRQYNVISIYQEKHTNTFVIFLGGGFCGNFIWYVLEKKQNNLTPTFSFINCLFEKSQVEDYPNILPIFSRQRSCKFESSSLMTLLVSQETRLLSSEKVLTYFRVTMHTVQWNMSKYHIP